MDDYSRFLNDIQKKIDKSIDYLMVDNDKRAIYHLSLISQAIFDFLSINITLKK